MNKGSLRENIVFQDGKPNIKLVLESAFSKEICITFKAQQLMKEHKTAYPIVVEIVEGAINFGMSGNILELKKGDIISLEGGVPHDLLATEESVVRLSLSKDDSLKRVEKVVE